MLTGFWRLGLTGIMYVAASQQLFAQAATTSAAPHATIGFAVPITANDDVEIISGKTTAVPAMWADFSVSVSERFELHVATELPVASDVQGRHPGSAGYLVTYQHHDIPIAALALVGGLDIRIAVSPRAALVVRALARYSWNSNAIDIDPFEGHFGPFTFSPGVGVRIRL
jgi:hypothetical protein